jgi:hypothetical protein
MGITQGARKWRRKTLTNSSKWKEEFENAAPAYAEGIMGASDGKLPSSIRAKVMQSDPVENYAIAGQSTPESHYIKGIEDAAQDDKWRQNWLKSFGG